MSKHTVLLLYTYLVSLIAGALTVAMVLIATSGPPSGQAHVVSVPRVDDREPVTLTGCGIERWNVKTGTDALASSVNLKPVWSSVGRLSAILAPYNPTSRVAPVEETTYTLGVTLVGFKREGDNDEHLVIRGGSGHEMIAEIPSPLCVGASSPFLHQIEQARAAFDARFAVSTAYQTVSVPIHLTGVGFWDRKHSQIGVSSSGIELHPILSIRFGS